LLSQQSPELLSTKVLFGAESFGSRSFPLGCLGRLTSNRSAPSSLESSVVLAIVAVVCIRSGTTIAVAVIVTAAVAVLLGWKLWLLRLSLGGNDLRPFLVRAVG